MLIGCLIFATVQQAQSRELARAGGATVSMSDSHRCSPTAPLEIDSGRIDLFEDRAADMARLVAGVAATLAFECGQLREVAITGRVAGVEVYSGRARIASSWRLEALPSPLERAAAALDLRGLSFEDLPGVQRQLSAYSAIPGFDRTFQHFAYVSAVRRAVSALVTADGGSALADHLDILHAGSGSPDRTRAAASQLLDTIAGIAPDLAGAARALVDRRLASLAGGPWDQFVDQELARGDLLGGTLTAIARRAGEQPLDAVAAVRLDMRVGQWVAATVAGLEPAAQAAGLADLSRKRALREALLGQRMPAPFSLTQAALDFTTVRLDAEIVDGLDRVVAAVGGMIDGSGRAYADVPQVLRTGANLAAGLTEAGFDDAADAVRRRADLRAGSLFVAELASLQSGLRGTPMTREAIAGYEEAARSFTRMARDYAPFALYVAAIESGIAEGRERICVEQARSAVRDAAHLAHLLLMDGALATVADLACRLYRNGHVLVEYSPGGGDGAAALAIERLGIGRERFELRTVEGTQVRYGGLRLGDTREELSRERWRNMMGALAAGPPG